MRRAHSLLVIAMLGSIASLSFVSCAPGISGNGSGSKQIVDDDFADWTAPPARVQAVQQWIAARGSAVLIGTSGDIETLTLNAMAKVPPNIMQWLIQQPTFTITFNGEQSGEVSGVCMLGSPELVKITFKGDKSLLPSVLLHELGHAAQQWASSEAKWDADIFPSGDTQWITLAETAANNNRFSSYARSYLAKGEKYTFYLEAWAEAFDSYFYSPESHQVEQTEFPEIYAYLKSKLPPPAFADPNAGTQPGMGTNPIAGIPGTGGVGGMPGVGGLPGEQPMLNNSDLYVMAPESPTLNAIQVSAPLGTPVVAICAGTLIECSNPNAPGMVRGQPTQGAPDRATFTVMLPPSVAASPSIPVAIVTMDHTQTTIMKRRQIVLQRQGL